MTDFLFAEKINKIIKDIPKPRLFYKKGISVSGLFRPYMSFCEYTSASLFSDREIITPTTIRFSAMLGDEGTADTNRNIKKMEVRFFTLKGSYDMLCQNIPVQFINDDNKLMAFFEVFKNRYAFDGINKDVFWEFIADNPESITAALYLQSSKGISSSFIDIKWFSVNTNIWINSYGEKFLVRMRWVPLNNEPYERLTLTKNMADLFSEIDPDVAHKEIINKIKYGKLPKLELQMQIIEEKDTHHFDPKDMTILWDEGTIPYVSVGILLINKVLADMKRNEICYLTKNTVEGIEPCNNSVIDTVDFIYKLEAMERGVFS